MLNLQVQTATSTHAMVCHPLPCMQDLLVHASAEGLEESGHEIDMTVRVTSDISDYFTVYLVPGTPLYARSLHSIYRPFRLWKICPWSLVMLG